MATNRRQHAIHSIRYIFFFFIKPLNIFVGNDCTIMHGVIKLEGSILFASPAWLISEDAVANHHLSFLYEETLLFMVSLE